MLLRSLEDALAVRAHVAAGFQVDEFDGPDDSWHVDDGALRHRGADYFQIVARRTRSGEQLLIRQLEPALVGLVVHGPPGARRLLLNARAEPGLRGLCQFSTTVQSTPANYERRHGGRPTPFLAEVLGDEGGAQVLHESIQYDWGQYYHRKSKRFVIVELPEATPAPEPLYWVDAGLVAELLDSDHLATTDLRVAVAALDLVDAGVQPAAPSSEDGAREAGRDVPLPPLPRATDDAGRSVAWVRTRATTREVDEWTQPLLVVPEPLVARLAVRAGARGWEAAVELATREGLDGGRLWYPAPVEGGERIGAREVSAEGGRFLRHTVRLELVRDAAVTSGSWRTLDELGALALASRATSVELRLLLGLAGIAVDAP